MPPRVEFPARERKRALKRAVNLVKREDLPLIDAATWASVHAHPEGASCSCVTIEVIQQLLLRGYIIAHPDNG